MQVRCSITILLIGASVSFVMTGCKKKVAIAPPPPAKEVVPAPASAPTASLRVEPATIEPGQTVTLKWSSTNATEATISRLGTVALEGTREVQPVTPATYDLVATGPGGSTLVAAAVNAVAPPPPVVTPPPVESPSLLDRLKAEVSDAYFDYDKSNIRENAGAILAKDAAALRCVSIKMRHTA